MMVISYQELVQKRNYGCSGRGGRGKAKCLLLQVRWPPFLVSPRYHSHQEWVGWGEPILHRISSDRRSLRYAAPQPVRSVTTFTLDHLCYSIIASEGSLCKSFNLTLSKPQKYINCSTLFTCPSIPTSLHVLVSILSGCAFPALHKGHHRELYCQQGSVYIQHGEWPHWQGRKQGRHPAIFWALPGALEIEKMESTIQPKTKAELRNNTFPLADDLYKKMFYISTISDLCQYSFCGTDSGSSCVLHFAFASLFDWKDMLYVKAARTLISQPSVLNDLTNLVSCLYSQQYPLTWPANLSRLGQLLIAHLFWWPQWRWDE